MNIAVAFFFFHNVLATLLLGGKFVSKKDGTFKNFGVALLLNAAAFAVWSIAIVAKVQNLETWVTCGVAFFIASLIFFLATGTQNMSALHRQTLVVIGIIVSAVLLYVRAFVYPSAPGFSENGFFFFNPHPVIQMLYVFGLMITAIPAIAAVTSKFTTPLYGRLIQYGFIAEVAGGIVLFTSNIANPHTLALHLTGWIMGIVYLILWVTFVFFQKPWAQTVA
jgi:hypothetical protein